MNNGGASSNAISFKFFKKCGLVSKTAQSCSKILLKDKIWHSKNLNQITEDTRPESSCYENEGAFCDRVGRLYTWEAAKEACGLLGEGWRLPSDEEWNTLAGSWYEEGINQPEDGHMAHANLTTDNNDCGFNAEFGGFYVASSDWYIQETDNGDYWTNTASVTNKDQAIYFVF